MNLSTAGAIVPVSLKRTVYALLISVAVLAASPVRAQEDAARPLPHPWRVTLGFTTSQPVDGANDESFGGNPFGFPTVERSKSNAFFRLGISRDISTLRNRSSASGAPVLAVYLDAASHSSIYDMSSGFKGLGVSLRTGGPRAYAGGGLGFYRSTRADEDSRSGIGGKLFAGLPLGGKPDGRGFIAEIEVTLPDFNGDAVPGFLLGYRF